jgi:hypothetical protein
MNEEGGSVEKTNDHNHKKTNTETLMCIYCRQGQKTNSSQKQKSVPSAGRWWQNNKTALGGHCQA